MEKTMVSQNEVLKFARRIKKERPNTSKKEMRKFLEAKFIHGNDPFEAAAAQGITLRAVDNPMDWLKGLGKILKGIGKLLGDKDPEGARDCIEGALEILY